jgi:hypothetical protein
MTSSTPSRVITAILPCNIVDASERFYSCLGFERSAGRRQKWSGMAWARSAVAAVGLGAAVLTISTNPADARGGHGFGRGLGGHGLHGEQFSGDRRHGNDSYIKAASDERDKLLNAKIKSICRGC